MDGSRRVSVWVGRFGAAFSRLCRQIRQTAAGQAESTQLGGVLSMRFSMRGKGRDYGTGP